MAALLLVYFLVFIVIHVSLVFATGLSSGLRRQEGGSLLTFELPVQQPGREPRSRRAFEVEGAVIDSP